MRGVLIALAALAIGAAVAWWSWGQRLDTRVGRAAALARLIAVAAVVLLLFDPGIAARMISPRPIVLLDNSVSMHAAGGHAADAARLAATLGDTATFGELSAGEPGAISAVDDALAGAVTGGRPVIVVTDGEITDATTLPPDLRDASTVRLVARTAAPDIALIGVRAPERLSAGDSLQVEIEAQRTADAPDTASVEVRAGTQVLLRGTVRFGGARRGRTLVRGALPAGFSGAHWLEIARTGAADGEPGDDVRWWSLTVTPTPGVVVLAAAPDWDARFLYRALKDVVASPVRGYAQVQPNDWRRMDDLHRVPAAEVQAAAKAADLLAVRGVVAPWQAMGKARLLWPPADVAGDWYLAPGAASPLSAAFGATTPDSLPPATAVTALDVASSSAWLGATARLARRGADVPVIGGRMLGSARVVTIGVDGLYRWAFRGGASEQVWRALIANAAAWLLATPDAAGARARPVTLVTQRGTPVRFRWSGAGAPVPIAVALDAGQGTRGDTLRFDGDGEARLALPVGRYRYTLDGGGVGTFAVEPFSDELVPAPVTLAAHEATQAPTPARRSLRDLWWLFALAVAGFGTEWLLRRRVGLR